MQSWARTLLAVKTLHIFLSCSVTHAALTTPKGTTKETPIVCIYNLMAFTGMA